MFDMAPHDGLLVDARRVAEAPVERGTTGQLADALVVLARVRDTLDGALARTLAAFEAQDGPAEQGAASTAAWARRHLRLDTGSARTLVAAGRTCRQLPAVAEAAHRGEIRLQHVAALTSAVTRLGVEAVADAQPWLLDVARTCDPAELRQVVSALADAAIPERLDAAYERGMDRRDVRVARTLGGYHVDGFLDVVTGAKVETWLGAAAAPRDADDERAPSERRVQAVHDLVDAALAHGIPTDRGVRPQLHVVVDAETLVGAAGSAPPALDGYGAIGPRLFDLLACGTAVRRIDVDGVSDGPTPQPHVLDVGRARRLATPAQRVAVLHRQGGTCLTPGCSARHLEVHHVAWWQRDGGRTDLDNLVGTCSTCHAHLHLGRLVVEPDGRGGWTVSRVVGGTRHRLDDHVRRERHAVRRRLRALRVATARAVIAGAGIAPAPPTHRIPGPRPPTRTPSRPPLRT